MSSQIKHFTRWRVEGNLSEVAAIMSDTGSFAQWWPEGWWRCEVVDPGDAAGLGRTTAAVARFGLPGCRRFSMRLMLDERPESWVTEVMGGLSGKGTWSLHQDGPMADIAHEWRVEFRNPILRGLFPICKPLYRRSLRRAMSAGEAALAREVIRRRSHRS